MGGQQFGPYELVRPIASGGMAELYLVKAQGFAGFEKLLALKVIHPDFASDAAFVSMLVEEAKLAVQLQHGNIAQTFDLGRVGDVYYIAMEFIDGVDLYRVLRYSGDNDQPLPLALCAYVAREALHGLDYAHRKVAPNGTPLGIVHRDVSPQNILVSYTGEVKLVDFGIAKASMRAKKTAIGVLKGKYYYMSPEQAWGEPVDARSDIFSMGIVLYELLVGQMLFVDDDLAVVLEMVRKADIKPPSHLRPDIPAALDALVMRALAKDPAHRYQSAGEFAGALDQFLRTLPVLNALMLSDYIRQRVAPGASPVLATQAGEPAAAARVSAPKVVSALTTPMRVRPAPSLPTPVVPPSARQISSYAQTNRIMIDREIDDANSLIYTEADIGREGVGAKLEAAREQFRRASLGAPAVTPPPANQRVRRASDPTAPRLPGVPQVPTPEPAALPGALSAAVPAAVTVAPPVATASRGWTTHALVAWVAAFAALGVAAALGYGWYQAAQGPARVWVDATVSDAIVTIDGGEPQRAGGALALRPGVRHAIKVSKPGYNDVVREVVAARGQTAYVMATLRPNAELTVVGRQGTRILVDGTEVGTTPLERKGLAAAGLVAEGLAKVEAHGPSGVLRTWIVNFDATPLVYLELPGALGKTLPPSP